MVYKIDLRRGKAIEWSAGGSKREVSYHPTVYVSGDKNDLKHLRAEIVDWRETYATVFEDKRTGLDEPYEKVLRVDLKGNSSVNRFASKVRNRNYVGRFRLYNVDFSPQFRYCVETGTDPTPAKSLDKIHLDIPVTALTCREISRLRVNGEKFDSGKSAITALKEALDVEDPDCLVTSHSGILPLVKEKAAEHSIDIRLGREPGLSKLAGENTFESFGQVGHSSARYDIPGRAVLNKSNSFFWDKTGLEGILYLVSESWKPVQESSWASIGNVLTGIQIREALKRDVLVPWNKWDPEEFKSVDTLHASDRGGFTFEPFVGVHREVHEVDFSSLYPNIMVTKNISPEKMFCDCHEEGIEVPGLPYTVCPDRGFIPDVLEPLIADRDEIKQRITEAEGEERERLEARSDAIKWILVSCFGYQGYRNSKFGRIECHEAINAFAREIILDAKEVFEKNGWTVVHGIVDSLWIKPRKDAVDVEKLCKKVSRQTGIKLEFEDRYDWMAFVPKKDSVNGALTRYFGKSTTGEYKVRGVEARQRSTPEYVSETQKEMMEALEPGNTEEALKILEESVEKIRAGEVEPKKLLIRKKVSKELEEYSQNNRTVSGLERARGNGISIRPGQDLELLVVDDSRNDMDRVRLWFEELDRYDTSFYTTLVIRAAESILSPFGWREKDIRTRLSGRRTKEVTSF